MDAATGDLLGTVTFCRHGTAYADLAQGGEAEVRMLAVASGARGRGVGDALVRACVEREWAVGARRVVLSTLPTMTAAHRLYERMGFRRSPERDWSVGDVRLIAYELSG